MSLRYAHRMHLGFVWEDTAFDLILPLEDESEAVYILRRGLASFVEPTLLSSVSCPAMHAEPNEDPDAETNFRC